MDHAVGIVSETLFVLDDSEGQIMFSCTAIFQSGVIACLFKHCSIYTSSLPKISYMIMMNGENII